MDQFPQLTVSGQLAALHTGWEVGTMLGRPTTPTVSPLHTSLVRGHCVGRVQPKVGQPRKITTRARSSLHRIESQHHGATSGRRMP